MKVITNKSESNYHLVLLLTKKCSGVLYTENQYMRIKNFLANKSQFE